MSCIAARGPTLLEIVSLRGRCLGGHELQPKPTGRRLGVPHYPVGTSGVSRVSHARQIAMGSIPLSNATRLKFMGRPGVQRPVPQSICGADFGRRCNDWLAAGCKLCWGRSLKLAPDAARPLTGKMTPHVAIPMHLCIRSD